MDDFITQSQNNEIQSSNSDVNKELEEFLRKQKIRRKATVKNIKSIKVNFMCCIIVVMATLCVGVKI